MNGLRLYGIVHHDGHAPGGDMQVVTVRDLAGIVQDGVYAVADATDVLLTRHAEVVAASFPAHAILPAPPGTVFRTSGHLTRWMELHYVALSDALAYVDDRLVARVHVRREGSPGEADAGSDLAALAADVLRALRRQAVATVPLRTEHTTGVAISAAFLVERELWPEFSNAVGAQQGEHPGLTVSMSGPWPPYDFVRLDFGS